MADTAETNGALAGRRARILVFNQYFWPGVEATAHLLTELCTALGREYDVTVVTGLVRELAERPERVRRDGVEIVRVRSTTFERTRLSLRAVNYLSYLTASLVEGMRAEPPDVVLCMTDPPIIADVSYLVARRFGAPLVVISQDVFPEAAVQLRRLENRVVVAGLSQAIRFYLQRADRVVAIGETMRRRLEEKGTDPARLEVIPNWVDTGRIAPQPQENPWSLAHGLAGKFVVMHSGNVGHAQNLDTLVRASTFLRDLDDLAVVIVGSGARLAELVRLAGVLDADKVAFLPYQPREELPSSLSTASVHVVGLAHGLAGYVVPSRLYGILAAGRPVIVAADAESETARLVADERCGLVIPPGRPDRLAAAIRECYERREELEELGRRGRDYVVAEADRSVALDRYRRLIGDLLGTRPS